MSALTKLKGTSKIAKGTMKGDVQSVAMAIVVTVVVLFVGIFMITQVADVTSINNTSDFHSTYTGLVASTGVIYNILILVLIIVGLAVAIGYLSGFGGGTKGEATV